MILESNFHRSRWKLKSTRMLWIIFIGVLQTVGKTCSLKNEFFPITQLCQRSHQSFLSNIPRLIHGAVITSNNERDMDCIVTFQTHSILEKFMIRFEELKIDCNDQLFIYDGAHAIGTPKVKISCDKTVTNIGVGGTVYTQTNFLTMRYVTDSWGTDLNGFRMIITAFKDAQKNGCRDGFQCDDAEICIHNDLVCDTINHCGDGGDERSSQFCTPLGVHALSMLDTPTMVAIVFGAIFFVLAVITAYILYTCRRRDQQNQDTTRQQNYQTSVSENPKTPAQRREYKSYTRMLHFFL